MTDAHRTLCREKGLDLDRCVKAFLANKRNGRKVLRLEQYRTDLTEWLVRQWKPQNRATVAALTDLAAEGQARREAWIQDAYQGLLLTPSRGSIEHAEQVRDRLQREGHEVEAANLNAAIENARPRVEAIEVERAVAALAQQREREAVEAERQARRAASSERTRLALRIRGGTADATERAQFRTLLAELSDAQRAEWEAVAMPADSAAVAA